MIILTVSNDYRYETENLVRVFYPEEKISVRNEMFFSEESGIAAIITREGCWQRYSVFIRLGGRTEKCEQTGDIADGADAELSLCTLLYGALCRFTGYQPPWGLLTGVRPAKLMGKLRREMGENAARDYFKNTLMVSDKKTKLAAAVSERQDRVLRLNEDRCFSLYISVPFCPTRCSYCSFVSHSIDKAKKLIPNYTVLLCEELRATAEIAKQLGLKLKSIYMGGGTPTVLSAKQLSDVLGTVRRYFDLSDCLEFTVEAGRPDTVTEDKLTALKDCGVGRISINPQTFDDNILTLIGRRHTVRETYDAFELARKVGFDNINMDLIAGLPSDTVEGFGKSLDAAVSLNPSNITVHTLALKRSSSIVTEKTFSAESDTAAMLDYASQKLTDENYFPYYMYRQSRCVGNLENVGWAKDNFECLYNVFMMEELHTVLACGGGAVTKLKQDGANNIDRIFNFKYPYEYIDRFMEVLSKKDKIYEFYEEYC